MSPPDAAPPPAGPAARRWADGLAGWAIPAEILDRAPSSPWVLPLPLFAARDDAAEQDGPSHRRARAALPATGGSVLDVGCGGGRATFALVPPATIVTGVDEKPQMLQSFAAAAAARGLQHREFLGQWPQVAADVPGADVVVCHHVAYNVAGLAAFALALGAHAHHRVVLELPQRHPLAWLSPLWQRFWGLDRPDGPTAADAAAVLGEAGLSVHLQEWDDGRPPRDAALPPAERVAITRTRLCLPADRDPEVERALEELGSPAPRPMATLWWDV